MALDRTQLDEAFRSALPGGQNIGLFLHGGTHLDVQRNARWTRWRLDELGVVTHRRADSASTQVGTGHNSMKHTDPNLPGEPYIELALQMRELAIQLREFAELSQRNVDELKRKMDALDDAHPERQRNEATTLE